MIRYPAPPDWSADIRTVGVTGTNGKTTTTRWVAKALLRSDPHAVGIDTLGHFVGGEAVKARLNYNGFLAVLKCAHERGAKLAAIEMTSLALGHGFASGWPCQIGVFTNLSHDHLELHGDPEHYLASKAQLFVQLGVGGTAILNEDDAASALLREVIRDSVRIWTYGRQGDLAIRILHYDWTGSEVELRGLWLEKPWIWRLAAVGPMYVYNAVAALLAAVAAGVPWQLAAATIGSESSPRGRLQILSERPRIVVDYAHTPAALSATIELLRPLCEGRLLVVVGAGGDRDVGKRLPLGQAAALGDACWITSDNPRGEDPLRIANQVAAGCQHATIELNRQRAIEAAIAELAAEDVLLVAGKGHERTQTDSSGERAFDDADVVRRYLLARSGSLKSPSSNKAEF